jgi:hemolysin D
MAATDTQLSVMSPRRFFDPLLRQLFGGPAKNLAAGTTPTAVSLPPAGSRPRHMLWPISWYILRWSRRRVGEEAWPQQEFLPLKPDLEDILSERPPKFLRGAHYTVALLIVVMVVIATIVKVDMIVAASGRLTADAPLIVVQPMQLSILREIRVRAGDSVHKGDVLATIDPTFTQADKTALLSQQDALEAQIARLQAELNDAPLHLDGNTPDRLLQMTLYNQRRSQYTSRLQSLDEEIARYTENIRAGEESQASLAEQLGIAKEVEGMRARLFNMQAGSRINYLDAQVMRLRNERDNRDALHRLDDLRHTILAKQAERQVFIDEWRRQLLEELVKARASASSIAESLVKAVRMNDLVVLTAQADGIVLDVAKKSVGSVVQAAEPVVTLVPSDAPLIAEIMVNSADVGSVKIGDEVEIKVDAFPFQQHGLLRGRLRSVGEDSFAPGGNNTPLASGQNTAGVFHRSQVELTRTKLQNVPDGSHLIPGMSSSAEIKVGSRSIISYFLYPIERGFRESIREP